MASAAAANPVFDPTPLARCLSAAQTLTQRQACIGTAAEACIETPTGGSTIGMSYCLDREWTIWDQRLNAAYQVLREAYHGYDADNAGAPALAPAVKQMQRAWIAYRDATCDFEARHWGGGTGGGPAYTGCLMVQTGEQALYLENWVETQ